MSFSLAVRNGDLVLKGNALDIVYGVDKLKQDIDLWMRERFLVDRFHPTMGSMLDTFIGGIVTESTKSEVYSEVMRILENYMKVQEYLITQNPQKLSPTEIITSINSIKVEVSFDQVWVSVSVSNGVGQAASINVSQNV